MKETEEGIVYQKVEIRRFPTEVGRSQSDGSYWKRFRIQSTRQTGTVSFLSFSPAFPHRLAATSGTRVVLYDTDPLKPAQALSKFSDLAHGGSFRQDGRLLVAGSEEGHIKVFNVGDRSLLRQFEGHKRPVRVTRFCRSQLQVLSGSDDTTVRLWDLSEAKQICRLDGHLDYVRAGVQSPRAMDLWATGGYDHICRLWDVRQRRSVIEVDHGAPIESAVFLPSGTLLVTAGGPFLCVWDALTTGRLLRKLETHHKTITAVDTLQMPENSSAEARLVSTSLDQHAKIYDLNEFRVLHDTRYKSPIQSFASTPDGHSYAVGMSNGTIVLRDSRNMTLTEPAKEELLPPNTIRQKKPRLSGFNKLLRKFRYRDALDLVLKEADICVVTAVVEELAARDGLVGALSGRSADDLMPILAFIDNHVGNPQFAEFVTPLLEILLNLYEAELTVKPLDKKLNCILRSLQRELSLLVEMKGLKGHLEAVRFSKFN